MIKEVALKNFQCFKNCRIPFHAITILIGENDSGKTAILKAIEYILTNRSPELNLFHQIDGQIEKNCEIGIKFSVIPQIHHDFPKEFICNNEILIKRTFEYNPPQELKSDIFIYRYIFEKDELNSIDDLRAAQLQSLFSELDLEYSNVNDAKSRLKEYIFENFDSIPKNAGWAPIKWNLISPYIPSYEYYSSSDYGNPIKIVENTLQSVYRSNFYETDAAGNERLKDEFQEKISLITDDLNQKIKEDLKTKIQTINPNILDISGNFHIDFGRGFSLSTLFADFGQGPRDLSNIGEGTKKRLFLAITEWDKEIRKKTTLKNIVRGYDEPDANLHYKAQKEIFYLLKSLSEDDAANIQPIICTHSLSMIDRAPPKVINHLVHNCGITTVNYLIGQEDADVREFLDQVSEISGISNSSLFFERCFLVVEGETELNSLPILYKMMKGVNFSEDGVVLVNIEGNGSWKSFLKLLSKNKANSTILFLDSDTQTDTRRSLNPHSICEVGFNEEFLKNNVLFVGDKEFEDIFPNEIICRCLNQFYPKIEGESWIPSEIESMRSEKLSEALKGSIGRYQYDHGIRGNDFRKPEFGKRLASIMTRDEILSLEEIHDLVNKIYQIIR